MGKSSSSHDKRRSLFDKLAERVAKPAPHGSESCSMQPKDKCPNVGNCMEQGCSLHGRTGRS